MSVSGTDNRCSTDFASKTNNVVFRRPVDKSCTIYKKVRPKTIELPIGQQFIQWLSAATQFKQLGPVVHNSCRTKGSMHTVVLEHMEPNNPKWRACILPCHGTHLCTFLLRFHRNQICICTNNFHPDQCRWHSWRSREHLFYTRQCWYTSSHPQWNLLDKRTWTTRWCLHIQ